MYKDKFVAVILVNGKPQNDAGGNVKLPFGTEYAIRFRNKNNRRAVVKFTLDGEDASGNGYIIPANSYIDIERFSDVAKKFCLASDSSDAAIDHGKNNVVPRERGVIEAHFYLEKEYKRIEKPYIPPMPCYPPEPWTPIRPHIRWRNEPMCGLNNKLSNNKLSNVPDFAMRSVNINHMSVGSSSFSCETQDAFGETGCLSLTSSQPNAVTVEGSHSSQSFITSYIDLESTYVTLKLYLRGYSMNVSQDTYFDNTNANSQLIGLSSFLRRRCARENIGLDDLARRTDISVDYFLLLDQCRLSELPSKEILDRIASALNVPVEILEDLMQDDDIEEDYLLSKNKKQMRQNRKRYMENLGY
jgi:transcriptional regulator with XRE-family HTH domain